MRYLYLFLLLLSIAPELVLGQSQESSKLASLLLKAQQAQARSDYAAAANDYLQAVKLQPDAPRLWANLGLMQHELGKYMQAIDSFQHAAALDPTLYVPNLFLGLDNEQVGKPKEAVHFLVAAEKMNPQDTQPPLALGHAYASLGKNAEATQQFLRVISLNPKLSSAWFALGIADMNLVETSARTLSTDNRNSAYAQELFAESLTQQARYHQAIDVYKSILASEATSVEQPPCIHSELGFVYLKQKNAANSANEFAIERKQNPGCNLALLGQARSDMAAGGNSAALQQLEELWSRDPGFVQARVSLLSDDLDAAHASSFRDYVQNATGVDPALANVIASATETSATANVVNRKIKSHASSINSSLQGARTSYASGHYGLCAQQLAQDQAPASEDVLSLLATCAFLTGDYQQAANASSALLAKSPHSSSALYWSIKSNEKLALAALEHFQSLEPNSARSHILLGDIYRQQKRYQDAQSEYRKALQIAPNDTAALLGLADAYYGNSDYDKTAETARAALHQGPDDPELNFLVGESLVSMHQYAEAEPYLKKSLQNKLQVLPHVHALLGIVDAETGHPHEAIHELKLGLSSDEDGSYHYRIARLYAKIGDKKNAESAMQQMKIIEQQSRDRARIELQESNYISSSDAARK